MKSFDVIGFDNGYDCVKIIVGSDKNDRVIFPSVTYEPSSISSNSIFSISRVAKSVKFTKEKMIVEYDGDEYYIGDYAVNQDARGGRKNFSDDKFQEPSEVAKFLAGISLFTVEDNIRIKNLVLGLNVEKYRKYRTDMVKVFKEKKFEYKLSKQNKVNTLEVENVICVPQGIGAYYDQILTMEGRPANTKFARSRFGLIDIGGKTVDAFISQGMEPIIGTDIGTEYGMSNAFKSVAEEIGDDLPYNLIAQSYIKGKKTIFWKGKEYNIVEKCTKAFGDFAQKIYDEVIENWGQQLHRTEFIVLCGGGAELISDYIVDLIPIRVKVMDDPQFSNANGYYKLGVYNYKKMKASKSLKSK